MIGQDKVVRKINWKEFKSILNNNGIACLYHFTHKLNIPSIKEHGGLYSWYYCESHGIQIPHPAVPRKSWQLDRRRNLQDYVRLFFCDYPPMSVERLSNTERLEVDPSVIYWETTKFSHINATDTDAIIGETLECFQNIRFDIVLARNDGLYHGDWWMKFRQAEVLVKKFIPLRLIKNLEFLNG